MESTKQRIDSKLDQIKLIGGKPNFINASHETEENLRKELEDSNVIAGIEGVTGFSSPQEEPLTYNGLTVIVEKGVADNFMTITYKTADGKQLEL